MSSGILLTVCAFLVSFVQCSSIITRNMIRMAGNPTLENSSQTSLPDAEKLTMAKESSQFQQIFPPKDQGSNSSSSKSRSFESTLIYPTHQYNGSSYDTTSTDNNSRSKVRLVNSNQENREEALKQAWSKMDPADNLEYIDDKNSHPTSTNITSEELSRRYWEQYNKFSYDFINKSYTNFDSPVNDLIDDKGFQGTSFWEVMQRMYDCPWSSELLKCIQHHIGSFFQFFQPGVLQFHHEESKFNGESLGIEESDTEEGRKKLSKKLQMLLPVLMMLKMTVLPALAVMALVSGKAFLLSLLSLGVALFAASLHPAALSASKRQEIAPQPQIPSDRLPNNYYYVM